MLKNICLVFILALLCKNSFGNFFGSEFGMIKLLHIEEDLLNDLGKYIEKKTKHLKKLER